MKIKYILLLLDKYNIINPTINRDLEEYQMSKRFEFTEKEGLSEGAKIVVDKETGVQYLLAHWTNVGGLTVLVDKDGKPLLDPRYAK